MMTNEQLQHHISFYQELLLEKGYTGDVSGSNMPKVLSNAFQQEMTKLDGIPGKKNIVFHLLEYAFDKTEVINFRFEFCFDPETATINPEQLLAAHETIPELALLFSGNSFPNKREVYDLIAKKRSLHARVEFYVKQQKQTDRRFSC